MWGRADEEAEHENMVSDEFIIDKLPPQKDNEANVSSISES